MNPAAAAPFSPFGQAHAGRPSGVREAANLRRDVGRRMVQTLENLSDGDRKSIVKDLNDLLQLDHDAVRAYTETIEKLENEEWAGTIGQFKGDHERHIRDLTAMVRRLGGEPKDKPHATGALKVASIKAGGVMGDKGLLRSFRMNERQVRDKYDRYAGKDEYPVEIKELIQRNAQDEHRHYDWVVGALGGEAEQ